MKKKIVASKYKICIKSFLGVSSFMKTNLNPLSLFLIPFSTWEGEGLGESDYG